jgi:adenylylsulfate kinase-like enzyme
VPDHGRKGVEKRIAKSAVFVNQAGTVSFTARSSHAVAYKNAVVETLRASAFQEVYHPESTYLESRQQPSSRASTLLTGYFPYL